MCTFSIHQTHVNDFHSIGSFFLYYHLCSVFCVPCVGVTCWIGNKNDNDCGKNGKRKEDDESIIKDKKKKALKNPSRISRGSMSSFQFSRMPPQYSLICIYALNMNILLLYYLWLWENTLFFSIRSTNIFIAIFAIDCAISFSLPMEMEMEMEWEQWNRKRSEMSGIQRWHLHSCYNDMCLSNVDCARTIVNCSKV